MYFSGARATGPVVFSFLDVTTSGAYAAFCVLLVAVCVAREYLSVLRMEVEREASEAQLLAAGFPADLAMPLPPRTSRCASLLSTSTLSSLLYMVNMTLAYLVMLVIMTYDATFLLSVVLASGASHAYFQRRPHAMAATRRLSARTHASTRPYQNEFADVEEQHPLTPSPTINRSPLAVAAAKKAALQMNITKDCCES